jgi:Ti-type conjugative transfer relaxase TraA
VQKEFVERGMVADLNVHWTTAKDGELQPHAHIMLTMREVVPGRDGHPEEGHFGRKVVAWNDRALLVSWRQAWAEMANARLAELGHEVRIDHRSYAEQGIALEPQNKIGPAGARREERGLPAERLVDHVEIARRNGEKIIAEPATALEAITRQQATFTRRDLARFVNARTADRDQFEQAMAKVEAAPELVALGRDGRGQERFSTREMLAIEQRMESAAASMAERRGHRVHGATVGGVLLRASLEGLQLSDEQREAYRHVTAARDFAVVVGFAGTGKSVMFAVARAAWEAAGYNVRGAALSGIAAENFEAGSGIASRTLASLEYGWKEGRDALTGRDVLVIDEAGLVGSRQMERVLSAAEAAGAKVVLVGDPEQLQAIEAGAAFRALAARNGAAELSDIRRQRVDWQREASRELATGRTAEALDRYDAAGMVHAAETREAAKSALVAGWDAVRRQSPQTTQFILTYTNPDVRELNGLARGLMRQSGALHGVDQVVNTEFGARPFAAGDRLMFRRNERALGAGVIGSGVAVKNGTLGTVLEVAAGGERLTVRLDRGGGPGGPGGAGEQQQGREAVREVTFAVRDYAHFDHGYAATIHKAQGVTVDRMHVLASGYMDRHAAYVALSRHRDGVALHYGQDQFGDKAALAQTLGRERLKDSSLDYAGRSGPGQGGPDKDAGALARDFAERRGLDPLHPVSEIVVNKPVPAPAPARVVITEAQIAAGRAAFMARYEAHRQKQEQQQQQAVMARDARAQGLVASWDRLSQDYRQALPGLQADPRRFGAARTELLKFGEGLREQPDLVQVLRERGAEFGVDKRQTLSRVLADAQPQRVLVGMMDSAETRVRGELQQAAAKPAARAEAPEPTRGGHGRGRDHDRGPELILE